MNTEKKSHQVLPQMHACTQKCARTYKAMRMVITQPSKQASKHDCKKVSKPSCKQASKQASKQACEKASALLWLYT